MGKQMEHDMDTTMGSGLCGLGLVAVVQLDIADFSLILPLSELPGVFGGTEVASQHPK